MRSSPLRSPNRPPHLDFGDYRDDVQRGSFYVDPADDEWRKDVLWVGMSEADLLYGRACVWLPAATQKLSGPAWVHRVLVSERVDFRAEPRHASYGDFVEIESEARFACGCRSIRSRVVTSAEFRATRDDEEPRGFLVRTSLAGRCALHAAMIEARANVKRKIEKAQVRSFVLALWLTAPANIREEHPNFSFSDADLEVAMIAGERMSARYQLPPNDPEDFSDDDIAEWNAITRSKK